MEELRSGDVAYSWFKLTNCRTFVESCGPGASVRVLCGADQLICNL